VSLTGSYGAGFVATAVLPLFAVVVMLAGGRTEGMSAGSRP
jgi:hypothetical protein